MKFIEEPEKFIEKLKAFKPSKAVMQSLKFFSKDEAFADSKNAFMVLS